MEVYVIIYKLCALMCAWTGYHSTKYSAGRPGFFYTLAIVFSLFAILDKLP